MYVFGKQCVPTKGAGIVLVIKVVPVSRLMVASYGMATCPEGPCRGLPLTTYHAGPTTALVKLV